MSSHLQAWEGLLRVNAVITAVLADEIQESTGLPLREYDVLLELYRARDHRLRMSELGKRVVLSRTRVSRVVESMVRDRLVKKVPDPSDGRATFAEMTTKGEARFRKAAPVYLDGINRHFSSHLTDQEATILSGVFDRLLESNQ